jgi:hypothetical protein
MCGQYICFNAMPDIVVRHVILRVLVDGDVHFDV